ncbi:LamG-like jellyroll fold domain-containing protein [Endozoicomonas sp. OPT23]|uniref:LamG-like jellyroll fold domain-containing protein n=1 Tax=Endozoicomonas sp. OPT23 TaxID=2072845 RepID=UPI001890CD48|nr:LamG-like jellyroll fold domain-containing protein [Endozoicomonas sp. OPT23]
MNKTSGGSILKVDLLSPEEIDQYTVANLKLDSGKESGITVSTDSHCLNISAATYEEHSELLSYSYDLLTTQGFRLHRQLSFLIDASSKPAVIAELTISTSPPDDHQLPSELLHVNINSSNQVHSDKPEPVISKTHEPALLPLQTKATETQQQQDDSEQLTIETGSFDISVIDDTPVLFTDSDFQFQTEALSFELAITGQPETGQLLFNNRLLSSRQTITRSDLLTGRLKYEPGSEQPFPMVATFSFQATIIGATHPEEITPVPAMPLIKRKSMLEEISLAFSCNTGAGLKLLDESGHQNHAMLAGDASWMTCRKHSGSTFAMNGTEGCAEITPLETGGPMTITAWVRFNEFTQPWSRIIDLGNGPADNNIILSHLDTGNGLSFRVYSDDSNHYNALEVNDFFQQEQWVHIAATIDESGLMSVYRNGSLIKSRKGAVPQKMFRTGNYLGKSHWAGDGYLNGNIDDLLMTSCCLGSDAIMAIYLADTVENALGLNFYTSGLEPEKLIGTLEAADSDQKDSDQQISFSMVDDAGGLFIIDGQTGDIRTTGSPSTVKPVYKIQVLADSELHSETLDIKVLITNHSVQKQPKAKTDQVAFDAPPLSLEFLSKLVQKDETIAQSIIIEDLPEGCELEDDFERVKTDGHPVNISTWNLDELTFFPSEDTPEHFTASVVIHNMDKKGKDQKEPELITLDINWPEQTADVMNIGRSSL